MALWALGCFMCPLWDTFFFVAPRYAVYTTPQIPMVTPEAFYAQARANEVDA